MVWNRIQSRKKSAFRLLNRKRLLRRLQVQQMERRELLAVDMGAITGVAFVNSDGTGNSSGNPPVLVDANGDLVAPGTTGAAGINITLYDDTNSDGIFDAGDQIRTTSTTNLQGEYRFDNLPVGQFFIQQQAVPQLVGQAPLLINVVDAVGVRESLIDDYSATAQSVTANAGLITNDSIAAPEVIGLERDISVTNNSDSGIVSVLIEDGPETLSIGSLSAEGTALLQYDGVDGSENLNPIGLGGESLAGGTAGDPLDPNTGLVVLARADLPGDQLLITVYSDAVNFSTALVDIPQDPSDLIENLVPFSSFVTAGGIGADFNSVGAIEAELNLSANTDVVVSIVESRSPVPERQDFANAVAIQTDLSIIKTDSADPVTAGNTFTYTLTVANSGPDIAEGVLVSDQLPESVAFVTGSLDGDSSVVTDTGDGLIEITVGNLAAGESKTINIAVAVAEDFSGTLINNAAVTSDPDEDTNLSNNSTSESTVVNRIVDVAVVKSSAGDAVAGDTLSYTLTVSNAGPSQADGVVVSDLLDGSVTFVAGSFDPGTSGVSLNANGQDLQFDVGTLAAGQSESFSFDVAIASAAVGQLENTAVVSTSDNDSNSSNDTSTDTVTLQREVDLILTKTVDLATVVPGQDQVVYTFTVSHAAGSLSDTTNVVVTDVIPNGLTGVSINAPTADSTNFSNGVVTVGFDSLPIGETRSFSLVSNVVDTATGVVTNSGSVSSSVQDLNLADNFDSATITAEPDFDLIVVKTADVLNPRPTDTVIYTVTVQNQGPSAAQGVVLTDTIPAGLSFVSAAFDGLAGTSDGTTVTFPANTISGGATAEATLEFTIDAETSGLVTNVAEVPDLTQFGESNAENNSDSSEINVVAITDLEVEKTVSAARTTAGNDLIYQITVTNNGPSPATSVQVVDTLPSGVTFISGTGPQQEALTASSGTVSYDAGLLASGDSFQMTINVTLNPGVTATQTNFVTVSTQTAESNTNNNSASVTTTIDPLTSTFSGLVFLDINNNGQQDGSEPGLADVLLTLSGTDFLGNSVNQSIFTDLEGRYQFTDLAEGIYQVNQTQPSNLRNGLSILGTGATAQSADDVFLQIGLGAESEAVDFDFSELPQRLSKRSFLASYERS